MFRIEELTIYERLLRVEPVRARGRDSSCLGVTVRAECRRIGVSPRGIEALGHQADIFISPREATIRSHFRPPMHSDLPLSDEHVVPFGINGPWVIANASCPNCAKITGRFEQQVQKDQLLMARTALKMKTRKPKQRPTTFPLYVRGTLKHVPIEEHAPLIVLQPFAAPSHHAGREHTPGRMTIAGELLIIHAGGLAPPFLNRKHGPGNWGFRIAFDAFAFPRLMAKVGHCLAAVALGLDGFEPWACPAMLSPSGDLGRWVGCLPAPFVNGTTGLHEVSIRVVGDEAHAFVRLFAQLGAQEYFVVVGKLTQRGKSAVESAMTLVAARDDQMR